MEIGWAIRANYWVAMDHMVPYNFAPLRLYTGLIIKFLDMLTSSVFAFFLFLYTNKEHLIALHEF